MTENKGERKRVTSQQNYPMGSGPESKTKATSREGERKTKKTKWKK